MIRRALLAVALGLGLAAGAAAQDPESLPVVDSVNVQGNQFLDSGTLLFYVSTKPGERYDERRLKDDFRRLWDTGFLDDLVLSVTDGPKGKIVVFRVQERKRVQIVDFRGNKSISTTNIEEELKKKEAGLKIDTFFDPAKARRVETIIKEMLAEKGHDAATVKVDAKTVGGAGQQVSFIIDEGPKTKVKTVDFTGNTVFSDGKLRKQMKKIKPSGFWNLSWLSGKTTYTKEKWEDPQEGDRAKVENFYLNHGYVTAQIGEPKITYSEAQPGKKPKRSMHIEIPVTEGDQYRVGDLKFEGLTVFKEEPIRGLFKLKPGDVYKESSIRKGYDKLRDMYGSLGYFQWTGLTKRTPDPEKKVVDVVLAMEEDKRYYVGRIKFVGNDTTRDKVIRREIYMNEGEVFNTEALKISIRRINQLGYFKPMEGAPELGPSPLGEDKIDVTFKVEEQNRNQFTFGGGVSGLEGTFINASFSTANFLGAGETFQVSAQSGRRTKNYQIAVRALPVRPAHHRRLRRLQAPAGVRALRHGGRLHPRHHRGQPHHRPPHGPLLAGLRELLVRDHQARGHPARARGPQRGPDEPAAPVRSDLLRRGRPAAGEPADALARAQHGRQPLDPPKRHEAQPDRGADGRAPGRDRQLRAA